MTTHVPPAPLTPSGAGGPRSRPLRAGALFAGYGGLELGLAQVLDVETAWVAEVDPAPSRILATRFPGAPNLGDVTQVDWTAVEPVDVITGGSPCQDLSHAGKRAGMRPGTRSGLWASMCDAIDIIRPQLVVWENVRGALSACASSDTDSDLGPCPRCLDPESGARHAPNLRAIGRVLGDLSELGFDAAWTTLRASDAGAPHRRERVFILAWPADTPSPGLETWREGRGGGSPDGTGLGGRAPVLNLLPSPRTSDTNGPGVHGDGGMDLRTAVTLLPTPVTEPTTGNGHARNLGAEVALPPTPLVRNNENRQSDGYGPNLGTALRMLPTPRATDGTKGGPNQRGSSGDLMLPSAVTLLPTPAVADVEGGRKHRSSARSGELLLNGLAHAQAFGQYAPAIARWEAATGNPAPAATEPTGKGGAHRLSPRFVEWMMGLPAGWVTRVGLTRNEELHALGNGVVPQQAAMAIRHLLTIRAGALARAA